MPITLESLQNRTNTLEIIVGKEADGDTLTLRYLPARIGYANRPRLFRVLLAYCASETPSDEELEAAWRAYCDDFGALLVDWDLLDDDDKPIPADGATLAELPFEFVLGAARLVVQDSMKNSPYVVTADATKNEVSA